MRYIIILMNSEERNQTIVRYNIVGITINLALAICKLTSGFLCNSDVIMLDGINSLFDVLSYVLSIISVYLGKRSANKAHPMGFGRFEYLFSLLITFIIVEIGIKEIIDSINTIMHPDEPPAYTTLAIVLMAISFLFKVIYGHLCKKKGKEINSTAMVMSGSESLGDAFTSLAILIAVIVIHFTGKDIESYLCIAISLLIIYTGLGILRECTNKILGTRVDPELKKQIVRMVIAADHVLNVSNLVVHNYGEGVNIGSVNIEVDEDMKALQISEISRDIIRKAADLGVNLTSVGVSAARLNDPQAFSIYDKIINLAAKYPSIIHVHSFVVDPDNKTMSFYIVQSGGDNKNKEKDLLQEELQKIYKDYEIEIFIAIDM